MTIRQITSILLATAAIGVAGCSSDSMRFNDFYANAAPNAPAGVDQRATGSVDPAPKSLPRYSMNGLAPGGNVVAQPIQSAQAPAVAQPQRPNAVSRMASGVRNLLPGRGRAAPVAQPVQAAPVQVASAANVASTAARTTIEVAPGDTLSSIAARYDVPLATLMRDNGISSANDLKAGAKLVVAAAAIANEAPAATALAQPAVETPLATAAASANVSRPATGPSGTTIEVASGDTLYGLARRTGADVDALRKANSLTTDALRVGQKLIVPIRTTEPTKPVEVAAAEPIATPSVEPKRLATPKTSSMKVRQVPLYVRKPSQPEPSVEQPVETAKSDALPRVSQPVVEAEKPLVVATADPVAKSDTSAGLRWPVKGRVIRSFGNESSGVDISVPAGTEIRAAEAGTVIYAGSGLKQYGKTVLIQHEDGLVTVYGHADTLGVAKGQKVQRGEVIAASGMTGQADSPRVHFQVRKGQKPVNPSTYLR